MSSGWERKDGALRHEAFRDEPGGEKPTRRSQIYRLCYYWSLVPEKLMNRGAAAVSKMLGFGNTVVAADCFITAYARMV